MVLIMPENAEGMVGLENSINEVMIEGLCKKLQGSRYENVQLFLPKFKIATSYDLIKPLEKLGMVDAFDEKADFKAMYGDCPIEISQIRHKTTLEIDEKGTVATAVTAVEADLRSLPREIRFDRPFLVVIRENTSGTNLFMGRINDPSAE
jgi:serpin B